MKIKHDRMCTFCAINDENTSHLLWKCQKKTHNFIRERTNWLQDFNIQFSISEEYFIFGLQKERMAFKTLNFILLYAKYFIYCAR